jgi:uncharacterized protein (DUF488 family)
MNQETVFTVGHSTHPQARLIELLRQHEITALCDVRSKPYSRINPQFNREEIKMRLKDVGIWYVFLGEELGARSKDPSAYLKGRVQYDKLAGTELFKRGLARVRDGLSKYRLALMCAEKDPLDCHRFVLISRHLVRLGIEVQHIQADGGLETHQAAVERLIGRLRLPESDMFRSQEEILEDAYRIQERHIAYTLDEPAGDDPSNPKVAAG